MIIYNHNDPFSSLWWMYGSVIPQVTLPHARPRLSGCAAVVLRSDGPLLAGGTPVGARRIPRSRRSVLQRKLQPLRHQHHPHHPQLHRGLPAAAQGHFVLSALRRRKAGALAAAARTLA